MPKKPSRKYILYILAVMNFTHIIDSMLIMPLGDIFISEFNISPREYSWLVSAYALTASISCILGILFLDRLPRKNALLFLYGGFAIGTFLCSLCTTYETLITLRAATGFFGGMIGALVLSIISDLFPFKERGTAMGILFASFLNLKDQSDERIKSIALNSLERFSDNKEITNLALYVLYGLENVTESYNLSDKAAKLYSSNKFQEAIDLYKKAIDLNPYDATFYENIGMCSYQLKQYEDVILFFEQSLEKKSRSLGKAEFFIGLSKVNLGKLEEGCLFLHKSKSLNYESAYNAIIKFCK